MEQVDNRCIPPSFWAGIRTDLGIQNPYPLFRSLGGAPQCSHAAASLALKDRRFSVIDPAPFDRPMWRMFNRWLIMRNDPEHAAIRRVVGRAFTKTAVAAYRPLVEMTVTQLLDDLVPRGKMEFRREFAFRLPTVVISELMGLSSQAREGLDELLNDLDLAFVHQGQEDYVARGDAAVEELARRMESVLHARSREPGDDLISRLLTVDTTEEAAVEHEDLVANAVFLLQAGHDTTMNTLTSGVYTLLKHPDQLERLRADPDLVPSAVEEMLRYNSAVGIAPRTARQDVDLPQGTVPAGEAVWFFLGAINRDPEVFDEPDEFDVGRRDNPHLAFSAGPHHCAGAPLARLELQVGLAAILQRLPNLRLLEEPRWTGVMPIRGLDALHVTW